ncbi:MAG: hypothetical protein JW779_06520 [Candidatus Thorarchaeota archaeon]|nr:hypothetical protein [Candidatus Thorarchaeota archaeon]
MLKLHEGLYSIVSFVVLFVIVWIVVFSLSYFGSSDLYVGGHPLVEPIIFSTMIAFVIAFCCYFAGGGTRDPKELTDGITVVGI